MGIVREYHGRPVSQSEISDPDSIQLEKHKVALAATMSDEALAERLKRIAAAQAAFEAVEKKNDSVVETRSTVTEG